MGVSSLPSPAVRGRPDAGFGALGSWDLSQLI